MSRYHLQKYAGISSRHTCPACERPRCFTLYIDDNGNILHPTVGRYDHESSCGYHRTPRQYFHDHPERNRRHPDSFYCHPERLSVISSERSESSYRRSRLSSSERNLYRHARPDRASPGIIPQNLIPPPSGSNHLITYLKTMIPSTAIDRIIADYRLASTPDHAIIFLQIDQDNQCRTGKIMQYNPATGHRIKDPDKTVALVESEKTAIISSALMPQYLWLATGGKSGLTSERLSTLKGRKIIVFPDTDAFKDWHQKIFTMPHLDIRISRLLEDNATPEEKATHIDLADWLIEFLKDNITA